MSDGERRREPIREKCGSFMQKQRRKGTKVCECEAWGPPYAKVQIGKRKERLESIGSGGKGALLGSPWDWRLPFYFLGMDF